MAGSKQYQLLFQLTASLGPNFHKSFQSAAKSLNTLQNDLRGADRKLRDMAAYRKQQNAAAKSAQRVSELQEEHERLTQEIENADGSTSELEKQLNRNATALARARDRAADEQRTLDEMSQSLREAGINTDNLTRSSEELEAEYERLQRAQERVNQISQRQAENSQKISKAKGQLMGIAAGAAAVGGAIYNGPVKKAAEFQEQMSTVQAISGATGGDLQQLAAKAKQMGATTAYTATEAGQAMEYMAMAGWKTGDMLNSIDGVMDLAAASGEDLAAVSDIVTDAMTALGMKADETTTIVSNGVSKEVSNATHFADVLAATATGANTDVGMLGESFKYVAATAGTLGYSAEDLSIALGLMANAGIKGSQSGTALKTALARMASPTDAVSGAMDKLGISLVDGEGNTKSLMSVMENLRSSIGSVNVELVDSEGNLREYDDIIADLSKSTEGLSQVQQIEAASTIFGKEAMAGMLTIVNATEEDFYKLTESIYNCDGAAKRIAQVKLDNLNGQITLMKSAWDALQVSLGELLIPTLTNTVQKITEVLTVMNEFVVNNPEAVKTIMKVVSSLTALKAGSLIAKIGFLHVSNGILEVKKAFAIISGIGLDRYMEDAGRGTKLLIKVFEQLRGVDIVSHLRNAATGLKGLASGIVTGVLPYLSSVAVGLKSFAAGFGQIALKALPIIGIVGAIAAIGGALYYVSTHLQHVRDFIDKTFGSEALAVFDKLCSVITTIGSAIKSAFFVAGSTVLDGIAKALPVVISYFQESFAPLLSLLPMFEDMIAEIAPSFVQLGGAVAELIAAFGGLIPIIAEFAMSLLPIIMQVLPPIIQAITDIAQAVLPVIAQAIGSIAPVLTSVLSIIAQAAATVLPVFVELLATILPVITQFAQTALPVIAEVLGTVLYIIGELAASILPIFAEILTTVLTVVMQFVQTVLPVILDMLNTIVPILTQIVQAILPVLQSILQALIPVIQVVADVFTNVLGAALQVITSVVQSVMQILSGLISFITGVFTGNWKQAWEGVKSIFSGIVNGIKGIFKGVINGIIGVINGFIKGINNIKIPSWVPGVGGKGINIPTIPTFAKGTGRTPDTFIAGEAGAELITNAKNRAVFTAAETGNIFKNLTALQTQLVGTSVNAIAPNAVIKPDLSAKTGPVIINSSPVFYVKNGEQAENIEEVLKRRDEELLNEFNEILRQRDIDDRRLRYD